MSKNRLAAVAALGAAIAFAYPASAATTIIPQDNSSPGPTLAFTAGTATATFGANYTVNGSFSDSFFFTLSNDATITSGQVTTNAEGGSNRLTNDLDFSVVNLATGGTTLLTFSSNGSDKNETRVISAASLPYALTAGTYRLNVSGNVQAAPASYAGNLQFAAVQSAVPEPGTWALMLLGFGGIGASMRRSRRQGTAKLMQMA
nr:FxDxF family PEP-CTERM protein [uncultured Sphingomonas sp.]